MFWRSLIRASRFFAVVAALLFGLGIEPLLRGGSAFRVEVFFGDRSIVLTSMHVHLILGGVFLIFAGFYGLFEERHSGAANLALGHLHFWPSFVAALLLWSILQRHSAGAVSSGEVLHLRDLAQSEMRPLRASLFLLLGGQFAFLANLGWSFLRRGARDPGR